MPAVIEDLRRLVEANDADALLRRVDGLCSGRDWQTLSYLQTLCREAVTRGKQLWSVADHIDYRLALEAPAEWAGPIVTETASRFLLGPLPEVVASTHTWVQLAPHLPEGPARAVVAHERVLRGEDLRQDASIDRAVLEIPLVAEPWEPVYPLATYRPHKAEFPMPQLPPYDLADLAGPAPATDDPGAREALAAIVATWTDSSNGRVDVAAVEGDARSAIASLGLRRAALAELSLQQAMGLIAWAGASGGAYGRRRGAAAGRFTAWWTVATLTDLIHDWPIAGEELVEAGTELTWYAFSDLFPSTGWWFKLAAEDTMHGLAWAVSAGDAA